MIVSTNEEKVAIPATFHNLTKTARKDFAQRAAGELAELAPALKQARADREAADAAYNEKRAALDAEFARLEAEFELTHADTIKAQKRAKDAESKAHERAKDLTRAIYNATGEKSNIAGGLFTVRTKATWDWDANEMTACLIKDWPSIARHVLSVDKKALAHVLDMNSSKSVEGDEEVVKLTPILAELPVTPILKPTAVVQWNNIERPPQEAAPKEAETPATDPVPLSELVAKSRAESYAANTEPEPPVVPEPKPDDVPF